VPRKRFKRKRKKKISKFIFAVLVITISVKFVWNALLKLELLRLNPEKITIDGNSMVSRNTILGVLNLKYGNNILKIDTGALENRLSKLDRINTVSIKRNFPDSLNIKVIEVTPAGYIIRDGRRFVVTGEGEIFPGLEGPPVKFKTEEKDEIKHLVKLLERIKKTDENFYNGIIAVDINYRNEVIIYSKEYCCNWPEIDEITSDIIKRNIYLIRQVLNKAAVEKRNIEYIDLRFIDSESDRVNGAVIVK